MEATAIFPVTHTKASNLSKVNFEHLPFGKIFTDHMFIARYENGEWGGAEILPFGPLPLSPSNSALHYGQSIFEGIKAYRAENGTISIFRGTDNFRRFNISADRMSMPQVPEEIFVEGMKQLIAVDKDWVPNTPDSSLYIRPFMFANDPFIGVKPADNYLFMILLCPVGPYYNAPVRVKIEEVYTRAARGGTGFAKCAGNYAASLKAAAIAKEEGFDQVIWTDAGSHTQIQEIGTMNLFFVINGVAITPGLEDQTILDGITRKSIITLLQEMNVPFEERYITVDELREAAKTGALTEAFGAGTAATISKIKEIAYRNESMALDPGKMVIADKIAETMKAIRYGKIEDKHGWLEAVTD